MSLFATLLINLTWPEENLIALNFCMLGFIERLVSLAVVDEKVHEVKGCYRVEIIDKIKIFN